MTATVVVKYKSTVEIKRNQWAHGRSGVKHVRVEYAILYTLQG